MGVTALREASSHLAQLVGQLAEDSMTKSLGTKLKLSDWPEVNMVYPLVN